MKTRPWGRNIPTPYYHARALPIAGDICDTATARNQHSRSFIGFDRSIKSVMTQRQQQFVKNTQNLH